MNTNVFSNYRNWLDAQKIPKGKKAVLLSALTLFAEFGFNGTSTAKIAQTAGVSQGTIFKYFKTKQDLLISILQPIIQNFFPVYRDDFLAEWQNFNTLRELVHFIIHDRYRFLKENSDAFTILLSEMLTNQTIRRLFQKILQSSKPIFVKQFQKKILQNGVRKDLDSLAVFRTLLGQLLTYFLQQKFAPQIKVNEENDLKEIEDQIIRAISDQKREAN